jgi:hypothetical protein
MHRVKLILNSFLASPRPALSVRQAAVWLLLELRATTEPSMAWTEITRPKYRRDEEWPVIAPHVPSAHRRGRPRETSLRHVVNAIFYIAQNCCQWRMLPKEFPPSTTVSTFNNSCASHPGYGAHR